MTLNSAALIRDTRKNPAPGTDPGHAKVLFTDWRHSDTSVRWRARDRL